MFTVFYCGVLLVALDAVRNVVIYASFLLYGIERIIISVVELVAEFGLCLILAQSFIF